MKKVVLAVALVLTIGFLTSVKGFVGEEVGIEKKEIERRVGDIISKDKKSELCSRLKDITKDRLRNIKSTSGEHAKLNTNIIEKTEKLLQQLKAKGKDTAKLEQDVETLKSKIKAYEKKQNDLIKKLQEEIRCDSLDMKSLSNNIRNIKTETEALKTSYQEIRKLYQEVIRTKAQDKNSTR